MPGFLAASPPARSVKTQQAHANTFEILRSHGGCVGKPADDGVAVAVVFALVRTIALIRAGDAARGTAPGLRLRRPRPLTDPTAFVVVGPPWQTAALDAIAPTLCSRATACRRPRGCPLEVLEHHAHHLAARRYRCALPRTGNSVVWRRRCACAMSPANEVLFDLARDLSHKSTCPRCAGEPDIICDTNVEGGVGCRGRPSWNHVGPKILRVQGADWPCTWAHPVSWLWARAFNSASASSWATPWLSKPRSMTQWPGTARPSPSMCVSAIASKSW